jgi:hypothetical protein
VVTPEILLGLAAYIDFATKEDRITPSGVNRSTSSSGDHWNGEAKNGLSLLGPFIENIWKLKDCCYRWKYHTSNSILGEEIWAVRLG